MSKVPIKPMADRIAAVREEAANKTASGLYLPDNAKEKSQVAKVVAVGDDVNKLQLKIGDRIVYREYAATELKVDGVEYLILKVEDVMAKVE